MRYLKYTLILILAIALAFIIIWASLFIVIFLAVSVPVLSWWIRKKNKTKTPTKQQGSEDSFKTIDAEYTIITKEEDKKQ